MQKKSPRWAPKVDRRRVKNSVVGLPEKPIASSLPGEVETTPLVPAPQPRTEEAEQGDQGAGQIISEKLEEPTEPTPEERIGILEKNMGDLTGLMRQLLVALDEGVKPRLESLEKRLEEFPKQLEESFTVQSLKFKKYVDEKMGTTTAGGPSATTMPTGSRGLLEDIFDWGRKEVDRAGGLGNLLRGTTGGSTDVDTEIANLVRIKQNQDKLGFRDWLRKTTTTGASLPPGVPPSVEHS